MSSILLCLTIYLLSSSNGMIVNTNYGNVQGEINSFGVLQFKKIPFAKPPLGSLRWVSPQEPDPWPNTLDATEQPVPACPQGCISDAKCIIESEDCLYLNIFAPSNAKQGVTDYTVMIWIYGGLFRQGHTDLLLYDPINIIKNIDDVIIVTFNYRLGILGFLYDNIYDTELSGNYGIQDQLLAIKWIYENIEYFGGNKENIVLFGHSAGAHSIATHLLFNNQYIKGAIMQSPSIQLPFRDPTTWYDVAQQFSNLIGCDGAGDLLDCWRSVDAATILSVQLENDNTLFANNWPYAPFVFTPTVTEDGLIPNQPIHEWQKGDVETPPFIIGTNADEFFFFLNPALIPIFNYEVTLFQLAASVGSVEISKQILDFYGTTTTQTFTENYFYDYGEILNDNWLCSIRNVLQNIDDDELDNIYYYNFDVINAGLNENVLFGTRPQCWNRVCHSTDNYYIWTPRFFTERDLFDADTLSIGQQLQRLWGNFAKTENPNNNQEFVWPKYTNEQESDDDDDDDINNFLRISGAKQFEAQSTFFEFIEEDVNFCSFWDQIGYAGKYKLARNPNSNQQHSDDDDSDDSFAAKALFENKNADNIDYKNGDGEVSHNLTINLSSSSLINLWGLFGLIILIHLTVFWCCYQTHSKVRAPMP